MKNRIIIATSIALALTSQYATAGSIADTYATDDVLTAAKMDNIKAAVNDNNTVNGAQNIAIGANTAAITTKQDTLTGGACTAGQVVTSIVGNTVTCAADADTVYTDADAQAANTPAISANADAITALETFSKNGTLHALTTSCHRATGTGTPVLLDTGVSNPPNNSYGPSIVYTGGQSGTHQWYCDVPIQIPPGTTLTLTGGKINVFDIYADCIINATLKYKTFGTSSNGTIISSAYSGTNTTDYATVLASVPTDIAFPAFSQVIDPSTIVFIQAELKNSVATGSLCRYSGAELTYTITSP